MTQSWTSVNICPSFELDIHSQRYHGERHPHTAQLTSSSEFPSLKTWCFEHAHGPACNDNHVPSRRQKPQDAQGDYDADADIGSLLDSGWMTSLMRPYPLLEGDDGMEEGVCYGY